MRDTCRIYNTEYTVTDAGVAVQVNVAVLYNGLPDIPCRLDVARFFRSQDIDAQTMSVNDYELHLPHDFEMQADYRILMRGRVYEIRKMMDDQTNGITRMFVVSRIEPVDNPLIT